MKIYVVLGRFGDIYIVCKRLKEPSYIACLEEFSGIVEELFPQHTCIKLGSNANNNPYTAQKILSLSHPNCESIICQQDGTPLIQMKPFRNFQAFQEYHASIQ